MDYTEDVKKIDVSALILHGDDDQIVPIDAAGRRLVELVQEGELKVYKGGPHGMCTTLADQVNEDLLAFLSR